MPSPESYPGSDEVNLSEVPIAMIRIAGNFRETFILFSRSILCEPSQHRIRRIVIPFTGVFSGWDQFVDRCLVGFR